MRKCLCIAEGIKSGDDAHNDFLYLKPVFMGRMVCIFYALSLANIIQNKKKKKIRKFITAV